MSQALLIPLTIAAALGALAGCLISLSTGHTPIAIKIGVFAALIILITIGALLPETKP